MRIKADELFTYLDLLVAARRPIKLDSEPGAGKSKMLEAYCRARDRESRKAGRGGYGMFVLDMSKANIADIQGYMMPKDETGVLPDGTPIELTSGKFTYPYFLYDQFTGRPAYEFNEGMIILEEWGQGGREEKRACAPIINDRRLGRWHFPHLDVCILSNRPEDRSGVTPEFDFLINRWTEATLQPTLKGFLEVSAVLGMTALTQAFAKRNEVLLFTGKVPEKQGPWMTQRSLHGLDDIFKEALAQGVPLDSGVMLTAAAGTVGEGPAKQYIAFMKHRSRVPTVSKVVADPIGCEIPGELDALTFLIFDLASKTTIANIGALTTYVKRMPADLAVTYFHAATSRDEDLVSTPEFGAFARSNQAVLTAIAMRLRKQAGK